MSPRSVIVVGAGFSGLSAASSLLQDAPGSTVTLLEAGSRIGGRACTAQFEGCGKVELGATWLHGLIGNPIFELAVQHGLLTGDEVKLNDDFFGKTKWAVEGRPDMLQGDELATILEGASLWSEAIEDVERGAEEAQVASVGEYMQHTWRQLAGQPDMTPERLRIFAQAWHWRELLQRAMDGCHTTHDMSAAGLAAYGELEGPNIPVPSGLQALAERLAKGLDARLGHAVKQIRWGSQGVTVTCSNGSVFEADAVIVTVSLGVLKATHQRLFQPPLPAAKVKAINALGMGVVDKVFVAFPSVSEPAEGVERDVFPQHDAVGSSESNADDPFEHGSAASGPVLTKQQDGPGSSALSGETEQPAGSSAAKGAGAVHAQAAAATAAQQADAQRGLAAPQDSRSQHSYLLLWDADEPWPASAVPAEAPGSKPSAQHAQRDAGAADAGCSGCAVLGQRSSWVHGLYGMRFWGAEFTQPLPSSQHERADAEQPQGEASSRAAECAAIWVSGEDALQMEAASDEEVHAGICQLLDSFPAVELPRNFKVYRSRWGLDPLFRGSYSYIATGSSHTDVEALAEPLTVHRDGVDVPVVMFCGEATHATFFGTVHGAYMTGQRAARELLDRTSNK